jgi:hypothetical protein
VEDGEHKKDWVGGGYPPSAAATQLQSWCDGTKKKRRKTNEIEIELQRGRKKLVYTSDHQPRETI